MRSILRSAVMAGASIALLSAQAGPPAGPKKLVAVLNFDYSTVQTNVAALFQTNVDIGKGIADLLVDRFVTDGTYRVIERKALDKVLAEQNFSNSDRADPSSAAKLAKILGVDAIVIGSITQFGRDDKQIGVAGSGLGSLAGKYGLGGVGKRDAKAVVQISARIVSTETAEVLAVASGKGESSRGGVNLLGGGGSYGGSGAGAVNMSSSNFGATIIGEAVNQAVTNVATQLEASAGRMPTKVVMVDGLVADASGPLVLNVGSRAGVHVGDRLQLFRSGKAITDPATGKVLRRMDTAIGEVTVTEVDESSAVATYNGTQPVKVGDHVKSFPLR